MSDLNIDTAEVFEPLLAPARYKGAYGGRGSGKSHNFAEMAIEHCLMNPGTRYVGIREVQKTLKESVKLLLEDKIIKFGLQEKFRILNDRIETPGGGTMIFQGMQDHTAESIKSLEGFDIAHVEEAQTLTARSLEILRPTIRKPGSQLWFSWNPRTSADPVDRMLRSDDLPPDAVVVEANWRDNPWFPKELEAERAFDKEANPERYAHIWEGAYEPQALGALWQRQMFIDHRVSEKPPLDKIVIGTDPAISSDRTSDEYGIIVCGSAGDHGYVLEDISGRCTAHQWAVRVVAAFDQYEADYVAVETNQGGEHVIQTLKAVRSDLPVRGVHVTRRKPDRAKPISALYALGRISHVGTHQELEDQCCLMTSIDFEGEGSPDRVDAMVMGMTSLFPNLSRPAASNVTRRIVRPQGAGGWMA